MPLISRKPTSPGRRFQTASDFAEITRSAPEKSLVKPLKKTGGRNCYGWGPQAALPDHRFQTE
jgi:large subunit ribosomal protein L2